METLMGLAAKAEILMASMMVGLLMTTVALKGMFRAVRAAGKGAPRATNGISAIPTRQSGLKQIGGSGEFVLAQVSAGRGQVSLRAR